MVNNPYLAEVRECLDYRIESALEDIELLGFLRSKRHSLTRKYSWAIPNAESLETIKNYSPIIEIGAGKGYWAHLLKQMNVDIIASDIYVSDYAWTNIKKLDGIKAAQAHKDRALFLCWAPYSTDMAFNSCKQYIDSGGKTIITVTESRNGCCANDKFFDLLDSHLEPIKKVQIPQWHGIFDSLYVYRTK